MVLLLLLLVLVAIGLAGAGLLGAGLLSAENRQRRGGALAALSAPVVLVGGVVLILVLFGGVAGLRGGDEPDTESSRPSGPSAPPTTQAVTATTLPTARLQNVATDYPVIFLRAIEESDGFPLYLPVGGLPADGIVRVQVSGFGWVERGLVEQCVTELGHHTACGPSLTVQFDEDGRADFLFVVRGDLAPGGCRAGQPTCLLRVRTDDRFAATQTVLVDPVVPGQVTVSPARGLDEGQTVEVAVTGFPAGHRATAVLCAPVVVYDVQRCSPALSTFAVDASGSGRTTVTVSPGRVGTDRVLCGPRNDCGVVVLADPGYAAAGPGIVSFSAGLGVAYSAGRVLTGIAIGLVLVGLAVALALRTDWTKPTEAATPEMDRADLRADQDLDELFGTDAELDERDPVPW